MSSRVVIKTLKFCTQEILNLEQACKLLGLQMSKLTDKIFVSELEIMAVNNSYFVQVNEMDTAGIKLFNTINSKLAEIEHQMRHQRIALNKIEQQKMQDEENLYRVRQLKAQEKEMEYQAKMLELEKQSYVDVKKQAIIKKAKEKGYSVQETVENGKVKLKLIKRIY